MSISKLESYRTERRGIYMRSPARSRDCTKTGRPKEAGGAGANHVDEEERGGALRLGDESSSSGDDTEHMVHVAKVIEAQDDNVSP